MAISTIIKYEGSNDAFIWKFPGEDFNNLTQLVVNESQEAIFFYNGQAMDTFGPGRYTLDTDNIPILTKAANLVTGVSIMHCTVYYINKTVRMAVKWGTDSKVRFVEPTMGIPVELGASGEMNLMVSDGRKMLIKLVGAMGGIAWEETGSNFTKSLQQSFRPLISTQVKSILPVVIREQNIDIVDVDQHLDLLSNALWQKLVPGFEEYGLTIPQFYLTNIVLPESDPNFRKLRELHTVSFQKRIAQAEAEVRAAQAESRVAYMTAEAAAEAKITEAKRAAVLQSQTTETEIARREAERRIIAAQAEAEAARASGFAEAQVMQAKGYNQKDVLQAEVQKAYAEGIGNMGPAISGGGGGSSIMGEMLGLGVGMAAMGAMAPQVGEMLKSFNPAGQAMTRVQDGSTPQNQVQGMTSAALGPSSRTTVCPGCGAHIPEGAKFCMECGAMIEQLAPNEIICPTCGKRTMKGRFCMECGASLVNRCPNCGAELQQGAKFCFECGTKLNSKEK